MPIMGGGGGGAAFNGGTITAPPLTIQETDGFSDSLVISTLGGAATYALRIGAPHTTVLVDGDGFAKLASDDEMALTVQGTSDSGASVSVQNAPTSYTFESFASATGVEARVYDSAFVTRAGMSTRYGLMTALNAAPADAALNAGQCAFWFDQTNGAAKLMVKGKSANGTVVSAAIALS